MRGSKLAALHRWLAVDFQEDIGAHLRTIGAGAIRAYSEVRRFRLRDLLILSFSAGALPLLALDPRVQVLFLHDSFTDVYVGI